MSKNTDLSSHAERDGARGAHQRHEGVLLSLKQMTHNQIQNGRARQTA
jgi:hypothetical protein